MINLIRRFGEDRNIIGEQFPYSDFSLMMLQSGEERTEIHGSDQTSNLNSTSVINATFTDVDSGNSYSMMGHPDPTFWKDYTPEMELSDWLKRPVKIADYTWTEGGILNDVLYPWEYYLATPTVQKKLDNYAYLQGNLHVKLVINASPFYYGMGFLSYRPLQGFTGTTIASEFGNNTDGYYMALSQRPHIKFFPQNCEGGEMVLPFFYYKDWLNITSLTDTQEMGQLELFTPILLDQANGASGGTVTVSIFAWMENVKLSGATIAPSLQAKDEYADMTGPISKPASTIAKVANSLSKAPYIGPFARATGMIATGVGSIASLLGFTNVPVIEDVKPMKSLIFHSFASTEISQPVEKLTFDPKNELTIDNRVAGLDGNDDLMINNFIGRESYETYVTWDTSNVIGDLIFEQYVGPEITTSVTSGSRTAVQRTPLSHIAKMFAYWRGSMIYRFKIIKTKYHSGRLLVQWDPIGDIAASSNDLNLVMSKIIDISETDDFEIEIPYHQPSHYQKTLSVIDPTNTATYYGASVVPAYSTIVFNGRMTVKVLNVLNAPTDSSTVRLAVFVRAGDDFEFADPVEIEPTATMWRLQSGQENGENLVFHGERIHSLRQLLRRTCFLRQQAGDANGASNYISNWKFRHSLVPLYRGFDPNGINNAVPTIDPVSNLPYNFCKTIPYTWIVPCFIGYRGSHIWHYNTNFFDHVGQIRAIRDPSSLIDRGDYGTTNGVSVATGWNLSRNAANGELQLSGASGQSVTNQLTQSGVSVLYPMYSRYRFRSTDKANAVLGHDDDDSKYENALVTVQTQTAISNDRNRYTEVSFYHSIGTDFSVQFFINVPTVYYYATPASF